MTRRCDSPRRRTDRHGVPRRSSLAASDSPKLLSHLSPQVIAKCSADTRGPDQPPRRKSSVAEMVVEMQGMLLAASPARDWLCCVKRFGVTASARFA